MADIYDEADAHRSVLNEAFVKFMERDEKYGGLWKKYGAEDSVQHCKSKLARMRQLLEMGEFHGDYGDDLDDALDLINYAVFYIRNVREGRLESQI